MSIRFASLLASILIILTLSACHSSSARTLPPPPPPPPAASITPGDVLLIRVAGEKDLSNKYQVSTEGTIDFPYIGRLTVAGLRPTQLTTLIRKGLAKGYIKNPQVSVFAKGYLARQVVYIWGQVRKAGAYQYTPNMPLIRAIALAGGLTSMANKDAIQVTRLDAKDNRRKKFSTPMSEGQSANYQLKPGDVVFVPERVF